MKFFSRHNARGEKTENRAEKFFVRALVSIAALPFLLSACAFGGVSYAPNSVKTFTAFNNSNVTVQTRGCVLSAGAANKISALLDGLNAEFSATAETSTTYRINSAAASDTVDISPRFAYVAGACAEMHAFTRGKFDPSVYPLTLLWKFAPDFPAADFAVPNAESISQTLATVGYGKFSFANGQAVKTADNAKLDFGGALKGYAADEIGKIMKADGATGGYVNVGGSSLYLVSVDALSVVHPRADGNILTVKITEKDLSVSTSGDYEKSYSAGGKTYSHIIDPQTGCPQTTGVASVTLIGKNGLKLDALSTALCLCAHDFAAPENGELYAFIREILSCEEFSDLRIYAVCVSETEKQILTNEKQGENFTLLDEYEIISVSD